MRSSSLLFGVLAAAPLALLSGCKSEGSPPPAEPTPAEVAAAEAAAAQEGAPAGAREGKVRTLVQGFIDSARGALERGDAQAAREALLNAYELDPSNAQVKSMLDRVEQELGASSSTIGDVARAAADQERVRRAQARLEVENRVAESKRAQAAGDMDGAIRALQDAELILRWNPYLGGATESGISEQSLRQQIEQLTAERASRERDLLAEREQRALMEKAEREREERERSQNLVNRFLRQANDAFYAERYKEAASLADEVLKLQPQHVEAAELKLTALEASHAQDADHLRSRFNEQWRETFDLLDMMDAPVLDDLSFPEQSEWARIANQG